MFYPIPVTQNIVETPDFSTRPFVAGFELTVSDATTMTFLPGCARSVDKPDTVFYPPINASAPGVITVDVSTVFAPTFLDSNGNQVIGTAVGFGGCFPLPLNQTGLAGNNTTFPLYAIGDSSGKNFTTIIVPTSKDFLPFGYDSFVRVGQVYIDGTTFEIIPFIQTGHYEVREYQLAQSVSVLNGGAATSATLVDLSLGDGPITPKSTSKVKLEVSFTPDAQADAASLGATGLTGTPIILQAAAAAKCSWLIEVVPGIDSTTGDSGVDYLVSTVDDALTLLVIGWTDDMGVALR